VRLLPRLIISARRSDDRFEPLNLSSRSESLFPDVFNVVAVHV